MSTVKVMNATPGSRPLKRRLFAIGLLLAALLTVNFVISFASGYGFDLRGFGRAAISLAQTVLHRSALSQSTGDYRNIIFLHHSVGANLIDEGNLKNLFSERGYDFWDHSYNWPGLRDPAGKMLGFSYNVPNDNTDPDGLAAIFTQPLYDLPLNTFSALMQHQVIAFKTCYPTSNIKSDETLAKIKAHYLSIRDAIDQHPDKLFIVLTQPPLNPAETDRAAATRARAFSDWVMSDEFSEGHPNLYAFDLFDQLADKDSNSAEYSMLRADYRSGGDSHPNRVANEAIAPLFVEFVTNAIEQFRANRAS
jgi:hypothetical protein